MIIFIINVVNCFISVNQTRKLSKEATDILRNDVKQMGINNISELEAPYKKSFSNVCTMHISIHLPSATVVAERQCFHKRVSRILFTGVGVSVSGSGEGCLPLGAGEDVCLWVWGVHAHGQTPS